MLKMTRLAALAAVLLFAATGAVVAQGQPQPSAPAATPAAPTAPAVAMPAAPASAAKTTEVVDNPYGLEALLKGGDLVARITLAILALMSLGSWYIIVTKVYEQSRMNRQARAAQRKFWTAPSVKQGAEQLKKGSPYRFIAESGLEGLDLDFLLRDLFLLRQDLRFPILQLPNARRIRATVGRVDLLPP